jgi:hypothetical protein
MDSAVITVTVCRFVGEEQAAFNETWDGPVLPVPPARLQLRKNSCREHGRDVVGYEVVTQSAALADCHPQHPRLRLPIHAIGGAQA